MLLLRPLLMGSIVVCSLRAQTAPGGAFVAGFNANGPALTVDGQAWTSWPAAVASGAKAPGASPYSGSYAFPLLPVPDPTTAVMLQSLVYVPGNTLNLSLPVANGTYSVYLWMIENYRSNFRAVNVALQGTQVAAGVGDLPLGAWQRYGPYPASVTSGTLQVALQRVKGDPALAGIALYRAGSTPGNLPPSVSLLSPAPGAAYFAPATIPLTASASDPDGSITRVEYFQGASKVGEALTPPYAFTWTAVPAGSYSVTATAWDSSGASTTSASAAISVQAAGTTPASLKVSPNGRYLVDRDGRPFFWNADTSWPLLTQYSCSDAETYIDTRAAQGFNVILTVLAWGGAPGFAPTPLPDCNGNLPFLNNNPATPNSLFFDRVDQLARYAADRGVTLGLLPMWGAAYAGRFLNTTNLRSYGSFLGTRFRNTPNLVWINGGDITPIGQEQLYRELSAGLTETDPHHLITYHPSANLSSGQFFQSDAWLGFNLFQTFENYERVSPLTAADRDRTPVKPTFLGEGAYEDGPGYSYSTGPITALEIRKQAYWCLLSGCAGPTYGHTSAWALVSGWSLSFLNSPGAQSMRIYRQIMESQPWATLIPDQSILGNGSAVGPYYDAAARTPGGDRLIVYVAQQPDALPSPLTVDLRKITAAPEVGGVWIDPRDGASQPAGSFSTSAPQSFTSPAGWLDALLILTAAGGGTAPPPPVPDLPPGGPPLPGPAINLGGAPVTVDNVPMTSWADAQRAGVAAPAAAVWTGSYAFPLSPVPDAGTRAMLGSLIWRSAKDLTLSIPVTNGSYQVFLWMIENHASGYREVDVRLESQTVATGLGRLPLGNWRKYGPFPAAVADGALTIDLIRVAGDPLLAGIVVTPTGSAPVPPPVVVPPASGSLRISADNRRLADPAGTPFLWIGDTAWTLFHYLTDTQIQQYLASRRAKGFTVVQAPLTWPFGNGRDIERFNPVPYSNLYGQPPFLNNNPTTLNEAFFTRVDQTIRWAGENGLVVALLPAWGAAHVNNIVTRSNGRAYGRLLGQRYRSYPNIIWVLGGDDDPTTKVDLYREIAEGIKELDPNHLMTFHSTYRGSSSRWMQKEAWLDFHMIQTWSEIHYTYSFVQNDRKLSPTRPTIVAEGAYEHCLPGVPNCPTYPTSPILSLSIRQQAWWAFLAGSFYSYGHGQFWPMLGDVAAAWESPGAMQMAVYGQILRSLPWDSLTPDNSLIAGGNSPDPNFPAHMAAISSSGGLGLLYMSSPVSLSLNLAKLTQGTSVRATWIDPVTGSRTIAGSFPKAVQTFTTPTGWVDAVLLLESI